MDDSHSEVDPTPVQANADVAEDEQPHLFAFPELGSERGSPSNEGSAERRTLRIVIGRARLSGAEAESLAPATVVTLDTLVDEPVEIFAGDRLIGRGELVVVDGAVGVRVGEMIGSEAETPPLRRAS